MFIWSEKTLNWLENAAEFTGYYESIAKSFRPYLSDQDSLCEIGCGLGYLALACAGSVKHVTAVDISPEAIARTERLLKKHQVSNVTPLTMDWLELPEQKQFDIITFSYFSAIKKNWDKLNKLCRKYIIAILANGQSGSNLNCKLYTSQLDSPSGRETIFNISAFLDEKGVGYHLIQQELEFGQPLTSYEDGKAYLNRYYKLHKEEDIQAYLDKHLHYNQEKGFYYLPKRKKSGILIIDLLKARQSVSA